MLLINTVETLSFFCRPPPPPPLFASFLLRAIVVNFCVFLMACIFIHLSICLCWLSYRNPLGTAVTAVDRPSVDGAGVQWKANLFQLNDRE